MPVSSRLDPVLDQLRAPAPLPRVVVVDRDTPPGSDAPSRPPPDDDPDTMVVGVFRGRFTAPGTDDVLAEIGIDPGTDLRDHDFRARPGEALVLTPSGGPWARVVVAGLGQVSELTPAVLRVAAGAAGRAVTTVATAVATTLAMVDPGTAHAAAVVEGFLLGSHRDERFRSDPEPTSLRSLEVRVSGGRVGPVTAIVERARRHAGGQVLARQLVTTPAGHLGPVELADWAAHVFTPHFDVDVLAGDALADLGAGGLVSVAHGSVRPPRLVRIRHRPANPVAKIALVGKGITFDSGGLSLKSAEGQMVMKKDMGGVAVLAGVMAGLVDLDLPVEVTAHLALAENMPSASRHVHTPGRALSW